MTEGFLYEFVARMDKAKKQPNEKIINAYLMQLDRFDYYKPFVVFCLNFWDRRNEDGFIEEFVKNYKDNTEPRVIIVPELDLFKKFIRLMDRENLSPSERDIKKFLTKENKMIYFGFMVKFCFYYWEDRENTNIVGIDNF